MSPRRLGAPPVGLQPGSALDARRGRWRAACLISRCADAVRAATRRAEVARGVAARRLRRLTIASAAGAGAVRRRAGPLCRGSSRVPCGWGRPLRPPVLGVVGGVPGRLLPPCPCCFMPRALPGCAAGGALLRLVNPLLAVVLRDPCYRDGSAGRRHPWVVGPSHSQVFRVHDLRWRPVAYRRALLCFPASRAGLLAPRPVLPALHGGCVRVPLGLADLLVAVRAVPEVVPDDFLGAGVDAQSRHVGAADSAPETGP